MDMVFMYQMILTISCFGLLLGNFQQLLPLVTAEMVFAQYLANTEQWCIALDKVLFSAKRYLYFSHFSWKTYW